MKFLYPTKNKSKGQQKVSQKIAYKRQKICLYSFLQNKIKDFIASDPT